MLNVEAHPENEKIFNSLLQTIGVGHEAFNGRVSIQGFDPVVSSRHRIGGATASALAAQCSCQKRRRRSSEGVRTFRGQLHTYRSSNSALLISPLFLVRAAIVLILIIFDARFAADEPLPRAARAKSRYAPCASSLMHPCTRMQARACSPLRRRAHLI